MEYALYTLIGVSLFYLIFSHKKGDKNIVSHWYYHFEELQTSSDDFYTSIEQHLKYLAMPDIRIPRDLHIYHGDNICY